MMSRYFSLPTQGFLGGKEAILLAKVLGGSLFIALCSQIVIPVRPVPMTMQPFAIMVLGLLTRPTIAVSSVLAYIAEAAFGLPVLAAFSGGLPFLLGPSGGYIMGFLPMAYFISKVSSKTTNSLSLFFVCLGGQIILYGFGLSWLSLSLGFEIAIRVGLLPFLVKIPFSILFAIMSRKLIRR